LIVEEYSQIAFTFIYTNINTWR